MRYRRVLYNTLHRFLMNSSILRIGRWLSINGLLLARVTSTYKVMFTRPDLELIWLLLSLVIVLIYRYSCIFSSLVSRTFPTYPESVFYFPEIVTVGGPGQRQGVHSTHEKEFFNRVR